MKIRKIILAASVVISLTSLTPAIGCEGFKGCATGNETPEPSNIKFEQQVLDILNTIRVSQGLNPLKMNLQLMLAARYHAQDMACEGYFKHDSYDRHANGELEMVCDTWDRIRAFYPSAGGENCAAGYTSPQSVMAGWMDSPGHRDNMLNPYHREIGVGHFKAHETTHYWVQDMGCRGDYYPVIINLDSAVTTRQEVDLFIYGADKWDEMRLKTNDQAWSAWRVFQPKVKWNLLKIHGQQTIWVEIRTSDRASCTASSDQIFLELPGAVAATPTPPVGDSFVLFPSYPNPFNPVTTIRYQLAEPATVKLSVYNVSGQLIRTLFQGEQSVGVYQQHWDGRNDLGRQMSGGIYFCRLECGDKFVESRKMVFLK